MGSRIKTNLCLRAVGLVVLPFSVVLWPSIILSYPIGKLIQAVGEPSGSSSNDTIGITIHTLGEMIVYLPFMATALCFELTCPELTEWCFGSKPMPEKKKLAETPNKTGKI